MDKPASDLAVDVNTPVAAEALARLFPGRAFLLFVAPRSPGQQGRLSSNVTDPVEVARMMRMMLDGLRAAGQVVAPVKSNLTGEK